MVGTRLVVILVSLFLSAVTLCIGQTHTEIRSLQTKVNGAVVSQPVATLGGTDRVTVEFDHLADDFESFGYRIVHLNANGVKSDLVPAEYTATGFNFGKITDYGYSGATNTRYVHYRFSLPDENIAFAHSGRYRVEVFRTENHEEVVAQTDVYVVEPLVFVSASVSPKTDIDFMDSHQQLEIAADIRKCGLTNPATELLVVVDQNSRPDSERIIAQPSQILQTKVVYSHLPKLIFQAGNEYRRFETTSLHQPNMGVGSIDYSLGRYSVSVVDISPANSYRFDKTQNGRFLVRTAGESESTDTNADYVEVHFKLKPLEYDGGKVFIEGDLTGRRLDSNSELEYNPETMMFEKKLLLKQGSYNFLFISNNEKKPFEYEGSFHQTSNTYNIKLYCRRFADRADRLVGFLIVDSRQ